MKPIQMIGALSLGLAVCHSVPAATAADGQALRAGQTVRAAQNAYGCMSADDMARAIAHRAAGEKAALYAMFKARQCGFFSRSEHLKVLRIDASNGAAVLVVFSLDDASAPAEIWVPARQVLAGS